MAQFKPGLLWTYILKQTAKVSLAGIGIIGVGYLASQSLVTVPPGQIGLVIDRKGDLTGYSNVTLEPGSYWINPTSTRVLPVDTLPWSDGGTVYIQCQGGERIKVEMQATMQVKRGYVGRFVRFTEGGTKYIAAPVASYIGSALWGDTPAEDVLAAYEQTPDAVQEQLLKALTLMLSTISVDISGLRITSMRTVTPALQSQFLRDGPRNIDPSLVRAVRAATQESVPPEKAQSLFEDIWLEERS